MHNYTIIYSHKIIFVFQCRLVLLEKMTTIDYNYKDFIKGKTIQNIECPSDDLIVITFKKTPIKLYLCAMGECCSSSYFCQKDNKSDLDKKLMYDAMFGKIIVEITQNQVDNEHFDQSELKKIIKNYDDCVIFYKIKIKFLDDTVFSFSMINASNGYYSGYLMNYVK